MDAQAVVLEKPGKLALRTLALEEAGEGDIVVETLFSGISTGTEKLLYEGRMPTFPGMGYPLVPGYESVGRVVQGGGGIEAGETVFAPGARCYGDVRGLFGGSARRMVLPAARAVRLDRALGAQGVLVALAATAHHALHDRGEPALPGLIIGHGVLGRLIARLTVAMGGAPVVHETAAERRAGALGYTVCEPGDDDGRYARVLDASGADGTIDRAVGQLQKGGEIVLAGFYERPLSFAFPPAFIAEARLRIAAEFTPADMTAVTEMVAKGALSLDGLLTHQLRAEQAATAYETAFADPACLKMTLDWRTTP
ncbi:MAG: chlorophyll synthesis pathway protein BchC [Pseudomonadota bacterium]